MPNKKIDPRNRGSREEARKVEVLKPKRKNKPVSLDYLKVHAKTKLLKLSENHQGKKLLDLYCQEIECATTKDRINAVIEVAQAEYETALYLSESFQRFEKKQPRTEQDEQMSTKLLAKLLFRAQVDNKRLIEKNAALSHRVEELEKDNQQLKADLLGYYLTDREGFATSSCLSDYSFFIMDSKEAVLGQVPEDTPDEHVVGDFKN